MLPMASMKFRPVDELGYPGRTYRFCDGPVVYPFGFGLSYTQFKYNHSLAQNSTAINIKLGPFQMCLPVDYKPNSGPAPPPCPAVNIDDTDCSQVIGLVVQVTNTGKIDGSNVIIVYAKPPLNIAGTAIKKIIAFQKVFLKAGGSQFVTISVNACEGLTVVDKGAYQIMAAGQHNVVIGDGDTTASVPLPVNISS